MSLSLALVVEGGGALLVDVTLQPLALHEHDLVFGVSVEHGLPAAGNLLRHPRSEGAMDRNLLHRSMRPMRHSPSQRSRGQCLPVNLYLLGSWIRLGLVGLGASYDLDSSLVGSG
jgi:hypothetical protein